MTTKRPLLIVFAGLPGVGKTTLAKRLSRELKAAYLRVDSIETPFLKVAKFEAEGYEALVNVARENLELGNTVLVDLVNPLHLSRKRFVELAEDTSAILQQFECYLDDETEHKRRVEDRNDVFQHTTTWEEVTTREYEVWDETVDGARTKVDTSDTDQALGVIMSKVRSGT